MRLLASAIAGRPMEVAAAAPGERAWTDGATVYIPPGSTPSDTLRMVAVQAALVGAGSLDHGVVAKVGRHAHRYLAVEAHRALVVSEDLLPRPVVALIDRRVAAAVSTAEDSLALARSRATIDAPPLVFGAVHPRRVHVTRDVTAQLSELDDDETDDDIGNLLTSPVGAGGPIGRLFARLLKPARRRSGGAPPGAEAPTHVGGPRPGLGHRIAVTGGPGDAPGDGPLAATTATTYPEWDVERHRYRAVWCTVIETDPLLAAGDAAVALDGAAFRRPLARLGVGLTPTRRQAQGADIDIDAAVEARVDAIAGGPHDDRTYIDSLRRRRDLAVLVLLDVSGSAGETGTAGRPVHEHQRAAAAALVAAVDELGDRVAVYGFNSRGRKVVQLTRVKAFDDRLDGRVARRLGALTPGAYTRLGAAIRHGTAILEARGGTPRRLLVVLSDGFAYDHGYEGRYGEADARRALVEARRRGVGCLCLSVGADVEPAALQRVFGSAAHAVVPNPEQLPRLIGPLFRSALLSAEAMERRTRGGKRAAVLPAGR